MAIPMPPTDPLLSHFSPPSALPAEIPRLAIALDGQDKCGKTHWALHTAPDPICLITNDPGTLHVAHKALRTAVDGARPRRIPYILEVPYEFEPSKLLVRSAKDISTAQHQEWIRQWKQFKDANRAIAHQDPTHLIRTVIWDQATDFWHLAELAHFGKLRGNARIDLRTELNADFSGVFWDLYKHRPDLNIILIHRSKKEYAPNSKGEDAPTGKLERDGYSRIGYAVDISLRAGWDGKAKKFYTGVDAGQASRFGPQFSGKRWYGDDSHFANLALEVFPDTETTPDWWGL